MTLLLVRGGEGFFSAFYSWQAEKFLSPLLFFAFLVTNIYFRSTACISDHELYDQKTLICISGHQHAFMVTNMYFWSPTCISGAPTCISGPRHAFLVPNMHFWSPTFRWERFKSEIAQKTEL